MDWRNWKTWSMIAAVLVALFAIYAFANPAGLLREDDTAIPRDHSVAAAGRGNAPERQAESLVRLDLLEPQSADYEIDRNLFAFVDPPPPPPRPAPPPPPPPPPPAIPEVVEETPPPPRKPTPPAFDWKFIGTFGRPAAPIAVFSKGGEIANVQQGETFDGKFILRRIGLESVEIGYVGFPPDESRRVPVGQ